MTAEILCAGMHLAAPLILVACAALFLLWYETVMGSDRSRVLPGAFAAAALLVALYYDLWLFTTSPLCGHATFHGALLPDRFGYAAMAITLVAALLSVLAGAGSALRGGLVERDLFPFLLFATAGLLIMIQAGDLVVFAIGLETAAVSLYAMAGLSRDCARSREAAIKYLIPGALATALLLYGVALVYGATGTLALLGIRKAVGAGQISALLLAGGSLIFAALLFKVSVVPFHMWTPDVYEGAPTPVTLFMSVVVKAAAFAALFRLVMVAFGPVSSVFAEVLVALAIITMTFGNLSALFQTNLKRLLAWSTVAHAGVLLTALAAVAGAPKSLAAVDNTGGSALLFYLLVYAFMNAGAFACVMLFSRDGNEVESVADLSGIAKRHPVAALIFSIFLLSLAGLPPLAGFAGKFAVFYSAARAGFLGLAFAGVLNALLSVYYYLKIAIAMYAGEDDGRTTIIPGPALSLALILATVATLALGI